MPSVYDPWVNALLDGRPASEVLAAMRRHYTAKGKQGELNECTLGKAVGKVKKLALEATPGPGQRNVHPSYRKGLQRLRAARKQADSACAAAVDAFLKLSVADQAKEVQFLERDGGGARTGLCGRLGGDPRVAKAFAALQVVPETFRDFRVDREERESCAETSKLRLLRKKTVSIPDVEALIAHARGVLATPREAHANDLMTALLFASGRRTAELLNGRSQFTKLAGHAHGCHFKGQLKARKHVAEAWFTIPLLVPFSAFQAGLLALREWQGDVSALSNDQVSNRYQPNLGRHLAEHPVGGVYVRPHLLRAIYSKFVLLFFDWKDHRDKRVIKYCLGHSNTQNSDFYDHIKCKNAAHLEDSLGVFPLSEAELQRMEELVKKA